MSAAQPVCHCVICHDYGDRDRLDQVDRNLIANVQRHGWGVLMIAADDKGPGWAFTVGLWHTHRSPELAMFGLDVGTMKTCLNALGGQIAAGVHTEADQERQDVIEGYPVVLKAVDHGWYRAFFGTALAFYRRPPLPYLQVVWPGSDGSFPWDPRHPERHRGLQPQLWLAPADHPPGVWTQDL